uniref:Kinetochore protein NDC80 n=1 Tax=Amphiprion ocellaris TaxID=80972 RepID=A0AAQ5YRQ8_AMPOC
MERGRMSRATGSRPSDLPMRVQDSNRMSMVYTTPQSKFGKLSIPKPQSGTSERRTSFFGARTSGAGMPRNSIMSGFGGTEKIKDARPLHDKSFVQQCIRQLHEFLTEQGYPGTLSSKTLQSPSTKEFVKMFEFIYRQLDPTFEMPNSKVEEEIPALLKALRYPFVLSKSSMYSVGAPHTWPQALAALVWLIDTVKVRNKMEKMKLQADLKKLQSYRSSLETFEANLEKKASELDDELDTTVSHLETLKHERNELQHLLQNQKFTPADVERINREKRELQQTISSLSKSLEDAEQHKWNEEIAFAKAKEKAELKLAEYHKLARKLKLIPQSAENACGHDFEIRPSECGPGSMVQYKMQIQVLTLISDVEEENSRLTNANLSLEESCEQVNFDITEKSNDVKQLREQIRKLDERLDFDMQEIAREEQEWAAEIESVENHCKLLEKKVNYGYDEAVQQLKAAQQEYHLVLQETNEERRTVANNLASVFTTAADHLSITEVTLLQLHISFLHNEKESASQKTNFNSEV